MLFQGKEKLMKLATTLKSASLFALLAVSIHGAALARGTVTISNSTISGNRAESNDTASGKRQHKPFVITKGIDKAEPSRARDISSGEPDPQAIGLLLPAVQSAREAARR
jgi:type VI protein secretion system component Hcp